MNKRLLLYLFAMLITATSFAQLKANKSVYTTKTAYASASSQDNIYVFNNSSGSALGSGELSVDSPDNTDGWRFKWTAWELSTKLFSKNIHTDASAKQSTIGSLKNGLYKVEITKGAISETYQAWVVNDNSDSFLFYHIKSECTGAEFGIKFTNNITYTDITDLSNKKVPVAKQGLDFIFYRGGKEVAKQQNIPNDATVKSFIDTEAYAGEQAYTLSVIDQYNCEHKSEIKTARTKVVKADFSITPANGEAPLEVTFTNNSINANSYEWYIYNDEKRIDNTATATLDSLIDQRIRPDFANNKFTYENSGEYKIKLVAINSTTGCKAIQYPNSIMVTVIPSLVEVPNVFTPNGDGRNDEFKAKTKSLKSFHGTILNRWGRVMFDWKDPKKGWDGKKGGKLATPGTYFYVITAVGLDDPTKSYTKKGSFMLIAK